MHGLIYKSETDGGKRVWSDHGKRAEMKVKGIGITVQYFNGYKDTQSTVVKRTVVGLLI